MKRIFVIILAASTTAIAQTAAKTGSATVIAPKASPYIALSTGFNNNTGLLGADVEVPLVPDFSLDAGMGLSTWGYKFTGSGRYYTGKNKLGWAVSAGFTFNTGLTGFRNDMETIYGTTENIELNLKPVTNLFVSVYRFIALGQGKSRLYFNLGYSLPMTSSYYTQVSGSPMSKNSELVMKILRPGGLIAGLGFSFGTGR